MSASDVLQTIKDNDVKFVDFRFSDPLKKRPETRPEKMDGGNSGHRPGIEGGYFPVLPVDPLEEVTRLRMATHPVEFDMYYSV